MLSPGDYSPPFQVVRRFLVAGLLCFAGLGLALMFSPEILSGHYFQPGLLALVHLAGLGWVGMVILGVLYQLTPVLCESPVMGTRWAGWLFWVYVFGIFGVIGHFWKFSVGWGFALSGGFVWVALLMFTLFLARAILSARCWTLSLSFLTAALVYLNFFVLLGIMLALNLTYSFLYVDHLRYLRLHAHLALVGWVMMVIMAASIKLVPMFLISKTVALRWATAAFWAINVSLIGFAVETIFGFSKLFYCYVLLGVVGFGCFLFQIRLFYTNRIRKLDTSSFHIRVAFGYLLWTLGFFVVACFLPEHEYIWQQRFELVYGFSFLFGFITVLFLSHLGKIIPFLVWVHSYSDRVGEADVPMMDDLLRPDEYRWVFLSFHPGFFLIMVGILFDVQPLRAVGGILYGLSGVYSLWIFLRMMRLSGNAKESLICNE